jgi:hypothetical protein
METWEIVAITVAVIAIVATIGWVIYTRNRSVRLRTALGRNTTERSMNWRESLAGRIRSYETRSKGRETKGQTAERRG